MRKLTVVAVAVVVGLLFGKNALAADKFGYVDIIKIASEYTKAKEYNKQLEDVAKGYEAEIDKKVNEIKAFQDKVNLLSDKEKEAKKTELEGKVKTLQDFRRDKETELRKKDFDNSKEVAEDIKNAIKQHAEKEGFTFVLDDRVLVFQPKSLDITDKVLEILNSTGKKK